MPTHCRRLPQRARLALLALIAVVSVLSPATAAAGLTTTVSPIAPGTTQLGSTIQPSARVANIGGAQSPTGSVAFHLCGPMAAESGCVSGGTSVGSGTISGGGNPAIATAATFRPTGLGWWCIRATYAGNATFNSASTSGGCFTVVNPTLPSVSIIPSSATVARGGTFSATVVGSHSAPSPEPVSTPWASFSACDGSLGGCEDSQFLGVIDTVGGRASSPAWTVPAGVSRVCIRSYWSGDAWNAQPPPLLTCADVTSPPLPSAITATLSASEVAQGGRPEVHAQVTGGVAGKYRGDVTFSVCGPLQSASGCTTGGRDLGEWVLQPSGTVTYPGVPATQPGVYCVRASFGGSPGVGASNTSGAGPRCFVVKPTVPTVVTTTTDDPRGNFTLPFGSALFNIATVTNGTPGSQITFYVCGPLPSEATGCATGGVELGSRLADQRPGNKVDASSPVFTPTQAGAYCFRSVYAGDDRTLRSESDGTRCRTVTTREPQLLNYALDASVPFNTSTKARAELSSSAGKPTGSVRFFACGPTQSAVSCESGGLEAGTGPVNPANGVALSNAFVPTAPGYWCFRAEFTPADPNFSGVTVAGTAGCTEATKRWLKVNAKPLSKVEGAADPAATLALDPTPTDPADAWRITGEAVCAVDGHDERPGRYEGVVQCLRGTLASDFYDFEYGDRAALTITAKPPPVDPGPVDPTPSPTPVAPTPSPTPVAPTPSPSPVKPTPSPAPGQGVPGSGNGGSGDGSGGAGGSGGTGGTGGAGGGLAETIPSVGSNGGPGNPGAGSGGNGGGGSGAAASALPNNLAVITSLKAKRGALTLGLTVPGPGQLTITAKTKTSGRVTVAIPAKATKAGLLTVKITAKKLRKLLKASRGKKVPVQVSVRFTPTGGVARTVGPKTAKLPRPR